MPGVVYIVTSRDATLTGREMCWLIVIKKQHVGSYEKTGAFTQDENISKWIQAMLCEACLNRWDTNINQLQYYRYCMQMQALYTK